MSAKLPPSGPGIGSSRRHSSKDEEDEEEEEEETNDYVPDDDDDEEEDDSEFDDNAASSSSSVGDDDIGARNDAVLDGILALDDSKHLHFQGDDFHLVSSEPVEWGVLNFAHWKLTSQGIKQYTLTMRGEFLVEVPWQEAESSKAPALKPPPSSLLKSPPSASQEGALKSPPPPDEASSTEPSEKSQQTFLFEISVTDYTGTKSDPSIRRIDHEHTHVPTNPDCLYHLEATASARTGIDPSDHHDAPPPVRFRGDYFPKDSDDPCRTVCKFVKPRKRVGVASDNDGSDANTKLPAAPPGSKLLVENGHSELHVDEAHLLSSTSAVASSPYAAAAAARGFHGDDDFEENDDDEDDDMDGDYDEDVDGDELLALQQEATMSTDDVLRKRYRGSGSDGAKATDDDGKQSATKRGRRRDDDDDSDYGF